MKIIHVVLFIPIIFYIFKGKPYWISQQASHLLSNLFSNQRSYPLSNPKAHTSAYF